VSCGGWNGFHNPLVKERRKNPFCLFFIVKDPFNKAVLKGLKDLKGDIY
jgi:hypothetical protein